MELSDLGIKIIEKPLEKGLGYWDETTGEIVINKNLNKAQKDIIIFHELLHLTASQLKQAGIIKRQPDELFITNCATQMVVCLFLAEKWKGLTEEDVKPFIGGNDESSAT